MHCILDRTREYRSINMRITCEVDVSNRLLPSFNMRNKGKASRAQLSIGRKPGSDQTDGEVFLMIGTKQDRSGTSKYRVGVYHSEGNHDLKILL